MTELLTAPAGRSVTWSADTASRPARMPILMYHEITARPQSRAHLAVPPADFADQLAYLSGHGYVTVTAADLHRTAERAGRWPTAPGGADRAVVLTFDDGFADFYHVALPELRRYGYTATLFVATGWIADAGRPASRPPGSMLSWPQIAEAASAGIEIGAHSHRHAALDQLDAGTLRRELEDSKARLEDRLGQRVTGLAYPYGYANRQVRAAAAAAGYGYACAVGNRFLAEYADPFALPRLTIGRRTGIHGFGRVVGGERLPPEFVAYRTMTRGWSVVRRARSMVSETAR